jgi:hypothetical protein
MVSRLLALRADRTLPSVTVVVLISLRGNIGPRIVVLLEALGTLENQMTSSGIDMTTFPLLKVKQNTYK